MLSTEGHVTLRTRPSGVNRYGPGSSVWRGLGFGQGNDRVESGRIASCVVCGRNLEQWYVCWNLWRPCRVFIQRLCTSYSCRPRCPPVGGNRDPRLERTTRFWSVPWHQQWMTMHQVPRTNGRIPPNEPKRSFSRIPWIGLDTERNLTHGTKSVKTVPEEKVTYWSWPSWRPGMRSKMMRRGVTQKSSSNNCAKTGKTKMKLGPFLNRCKWMKKRPRSDLLQQNYRCAAGSTSTCGPGTRTVGGQTSSWTKYGRCCWATTQRPSIWQRISKNFWTWHSRQGVCGRQSPGNTGPKKEWRMGVPPMRWWSLRCVCRYLSSWWWMNGMYKGILDDIDEQTWQKMSEDWNASWVRVVVWVILAQLHRRDHWTSRVELFRFVLYECGMCAIGMGLLGIHELISVWPLLRCWRIRSSCQWAWWR